MYLRRDMPCTRQKGEEGGKSTFSTRPPIVDNRHVCFRASIRYNKQALPFSQSENNELSNMNTISQILTGSHVFQPERFLISTATIRRCGKTGMLGWVGGWMNVLLVTCVWCRCRNDNHIFFWVMEKGKHSFPVQGAAFWQRQKIVASTLSSIKAH